MAERKFLFISDGGFHEEQSTSDTITLGGLTMGGNIDMNSAGKITNANAATTDGDVLVYGQSSANLAGLTIDTANLTLSGGVTIDGVPNPTSSGEVANKDYVDLYVLSSGKLKEMVLHEDQLDNTEGVLGACALVLQNQAANDDRVVLTDGTTTRTYYFGTGTGDVQVTIGASVAESMQNLATAIAGDSSGVWQSTVFTTDLDAIDTDGVVVIIEDDNDGTASEIYGTNWDAGDCQIVDFGGDYDYSSKTLADIPGSDPASTNFGFRRTQASLDAGEIHYSENDDVQYSWDDDANVWNVMTGSGSIPDATAASGGGVKGKITVDSDYGLSVSTGILSMNITADKGLYFNSGALEIEIDDTPDTLDADADGLKVVGVPSLFKVGGTAVGATVTAANLDDLTDGSDADSLHTHTNSSVTVTHASTTGQTTDDHHNQAHAIDGSDHTSSGLTTGHVLTATGATTFAFQALTGVDEAARVENNYNSATSLAAGDPVYLDATNDQVDKGDSGTDSKSWIIGVARGTGTSAVPIVSDGVAANVLTSATAGNRYFLANGGGLATTPPASGNRVILCGYAINATDLFVKIHDFGKKP